MAPPPADKVKTRSNSKDDGDMMNMINDKMEMLFREMHEFRVETKDLGVSIESTHSKIDDIMKLFQAQRVDIDCCLDNISTLRSENISLKKEIHEVHTELSNLQQYTRNNSVDIQGVPELRGENIVDVVHRVSRAVRFDLKEDMIDVVHRLAGGKGDSRPRGIILKFVRRTDRDELLRLAKVKRGFSASELGTTSDNKVFINPSLSKNNRQLLFLARTSVREGAVKYAWFNNGKVWIRKSDGQPAIAITSRDQLQGLTTRHQPTQ